MDPWIPLSCAVQNFIKKNETGMAGANQGAQG